MNEINDLKGQELPLKRETYRVWKGMHNRAGKVPYYENVIICYDWYFFSKFYYWYVPQYERGWQVDKDIIGDGTTYSPDTCIVVPRDVNNMFRVTSNSTSYPGVYHDKRTNRYYAQIKTFDSKCNAGGSETAEGAHELYMMARKEKYLSLSIKYSKHQVLSDLLKKLSEQ